ncbi:PHP domain-containing protein [Thermococcus sp.]|uniref:PHP domain-containing protein n=1 Tax=Thermococcus sp. TaxID=35749 RepID=UPI002615BE7A|nr:PHP domain-containing protein [Thermococcus sp.]
MLHDAHTHTLYSDGEGEVVDNIAEAEMKGLLLVAITDHVHYLSEGSFNAYLGEIGRWGRESDITVLAGVEGNITPNGVDVPGWMARKLDFVIASVHEWVERPEEYLNLVRIALTDENVDVIGHFGANFPYIGYPLWEELLEIIKLAEENGKAFEISSSYRVPDLEFVRECIKRGVKLTFASDAHRPENVGNVGWSVNLFKKAGGRLEDLLFSEYL